MREKLEVKLILFVFIALLAGVMTTSLLITMVEKHNVFELSRTRLIGAARIVSAGIERTMLEGKAEVTHAMIGDMGLVSGFEEIEVYNWDGRRAFQRGAIPSESEALMKLGATGEELSIEHDETLLVYLPLHNKPACRACHPVDKPILGAVKVAVSLSKEVSQLKEFNFLVVLWSILGVAVLGGVFWFVIRRWVIVPVKALERAAEKMSLGDLTFQTDIDVRDEIGRLDTSIKQSLTSVSAILRMVKEVSRRVSVAADAVESDSKNVVESTQLEAEAVAEISSSVEELNAAITEIAEGTEGLAKSVEETASSIEEMATTIATITGVTHEVSEGIDATSSSIEQLSATTREVADNAGRLATITDETLSSVEEIIFSIKEVEGNAKEAARLSEKVEEDATTLGVASMKKVMEGMERIKESVSRTAGAVAKLQGRSQEIGNILDVIDEITDQTTLLSLNAAILAAQAGEHGRGFSVVANEIKDLAERTALSTKEIDNLIKSVQLEVAESAGALQVGLRSVDEGMSAAREAQGALRKILDSSRRSAEMAASIEKATEEQAGAARYVTESTERVRTMVDMIAKATSEQTRGVTLIIGASERMRDAAFQAEKATKQQAEGSKQIARVVESISDRTRLISRAIYEQKIGANQIWSSVEKIKDLPVENRAIAFRINRSLQRLLKDAELVTSELDRFKLHERRGERVFRMGVVPFAPPALMYRKFLPLADYLSRRTGFRIELRVASDFASAVEEITHGVTHLCYMTTLTYIKARKAGSVELLAMSLREGKPHHHSVIVTAASREIASVRELKGRSFAFVDPNSFSGYRMPKAMLGEEGVKLADLSYHNFVGYHDDVVRVVLRGDYDAGGVMEAAALKHKDEGLRILKTSPEIPEFNIAVSRSLAREEADALKAAIMSLNEGSDEARAVLESISPHTTGFTAATDADFDPVREILTEEDEQ